jgi:hypothetical protein
MSGDRHPNAGRFTALATLVASGALFLTALFGIASIDPSGGSVAPAGGTPTIHSISLDQKTRGHKRDCPFKKHDRSQNGESSSNGVSY